MSAFSAVSHQSRRTLIAFLLCFLAFSFAVEAKMAWYRPADGPHCDVRAAKAMPADTPELVSDGVPAPDPLHPQFPVVFLLEIVAVTAFGVPLTRHRNPLGLRTPLPAAAHFYPGIFLRPPPVR